MKSNSQKINVKTSAHTELITITDTVADAVRSLGLADGIVHVFITHTTCGLTINENADPDVKKDLLNRLETLAPWSLSQDRHMEGNSAAHLKSSLLGSSLSIPVINGRMSLGTWQGIYLGEFDGPRTRSLTITCIS